MIRSLGEADKAALGDAVDLIILLDNKPFSSEAVSM